MRESDEAVALSDPGASHSVLFVCTANICRSPMAMGLLKRKTVSECEDWRISSAGTAAVPGMLASFNSMAVLMERGVDLTWHRSQPVSHEMIGDYKLVLTMERGQKEALRAAFPEFAGRIFLLSEMIGKSSDIVDPYGLSLADYRETAEEIERIIELGFEKIERLSRDGPTGSKNA